jgi:hypothetical protein
MVTRRPYESSTRFLNRAITLAKPANKALQVTPLRWATFGLPGAAMSHVMSHLLGVGGAPELDR